jgi:hypothetical protein
MRRQKTLREKIETRIADKQDDVFLPREFSDLGGEVKIKFYGCCVIWCEQAA